MDSLKLMGMAALAVLGALLVASCAPLPTLNALVPDDTHQRTRGVAYGPHERQKLDVYRPNQVAPAAGYPLVVFFYGGSWNSGERAQYRFVGEALAARGVLTLVADYRLYPAVTYPDFLDDSARALAYGIRQAAALGADPMRVFVMGHSAGAYNAAMLALDDRWLQAQGLDRRRLAGWIGLAGPYDFLPIRNPDVKPVFHHPNYPPDSQPIDFDLFGSPPGFIGAAANDDLVDPQRNSARMAERLQAAGVAVTCKIYSGVNHLTLAGAFAWPLRWLAPVADDVAGFIATPATRTHPSAHSASSAHPASGSIVERPEEPRPGGVCPQGNHA